MVEFSGRQCSAGVVAITGASGFVGAFLCQNLESAGFKVVRITRRGGGDSRAVGDIGFNPDWDSCLKGVDTVVHCAAIAHQPLGDTPEQKDYLHRVNCRAVKDLADACIRSGVSRLLFLSSVKVYGESTSLRPPFHESDQRLPEDDYGRSKFHAERTLEHFGESELDVCSLRLPLVYGVGAKANFRRLQRLAEAGFPLPLASIDNRRSLLSLLNLGSVVRGLLNLKAWPFNALNVADPSPVSVSDLVRWLAVASGTEARLFPFPVQVMRWMGALASRGDMVERIVGDLEVSTELLRTELPEIRLMSTQLCIQEIFSGQ